MSDFTFSVKAHSENSTKTVVKARGFEMIIDEPADLGGTNQGANPVEFILGAFAGCLNVVSHVVAKEMGIEMRGVEIEISGDLNPAKFAGQSDEERAGFKQIEVNISPDCDADKAILTKWIETVENRCPVSDNIQNPTPVKLYLK